MAVTPFPNDGVLTLAKLATAISAAPALLGVPEKARLRGVIMRGHDERWSPFALKFEIGCSRYESTGTVDAGGLILFDSTVSTRDIGEPASLRTFIQSWRDSVPRPIGLGNIQDPIQVQRQSSTNGSPPCWQLSLYERLNEEIQNIVPRGVFTNSDARFYASSAGDAAAQWLEEETLSEYSSVRSGIDAKIWDPRAFFGRAERRKDSLEVEVNFQAGLRLECTAIFRLDPKPQTVTQSIGERGTVVFPVPAGAKRCQLLLVGADNFCFDERPVWLESNRPEAIFTPDARTEKRPLRRRARRAENFVNPKRLRALKGIKNARFDLSRLIRLCDELNQSWKTKSLFAVAALTRTIIDHVPPLFEYNTFAEVANNYPGGKSFRESMTHLEKSARKIADNHLHSSARQREALPTATQVDFSREIDVLLGEIVRTLGMGEAMSV
jgi:hypothetical protein